MNAEPRCIWPLGADLGEGPLWMAADATLWFVDILGRQLHRCAEDGSRRQSWPLPRRVGFVLPLGDGGLVLGLQGGLARFDPATGAMSPLMDVEPQHEDNRINDGHVDARGRLRFGTMHLHAARASGRLYRVGPDGALLPQDGPYAVTNGPAFSPDGRVLYHADTMQRTVHAFDVADDGALSNKRVFATLPDGYPDGMAVDVQGHVWLGVFAGGRPERRDPHGHLVQTVPFPCSHVTKLAFGGPDLRTAFVTTARTGLTPAQQVQEPLAGGLFSFRVPVAGLPQHAITEGFAR